MEPEEPTTLPVDEQETENAPEEPVVVLGYN